MKRAPGTCAVPGCHLVPIYRGRCSVHVQWQGMSPRQRGRALVERRRRLMRTRGQRCEQCGEPTPAASLQLHHLDGNTLNDRPSNTRLLCHACHVATFGQQQTLGL